LRAKKIEGSYNEGALRLNNSHRGRGFIRVVARRKITAETQYVALLRGINVGGNNLIKMADLKACFEKLDLAEVATYIQSGNVLFSTTETDKTRLINTISLPLTAP
jgi:hypothetical protein